MTTHHFEGLKRVLLHINIASTVGTYNQSLENAMNMLVKNWSWKKLDSPATEVQTWSSAKNYSDIQ